MVSVKEGPRPQGGTGKHFHQPTSYMRGPGPEKDGHTSPPASLLQEYHAL